MWDGVQYFTLVYKTAISLSLLPSSLISPWALLSLSQKSKAKEELKKTLLSFNNEEKELQFGASASSPQHWLFKPPAPP